MQPAHNLITEGRSDLGFSRFHNQFHHVPVPHILWKNRFNRFWRFSTYYSKLPFPDDSAVFHTYPEISYSDQVQVEWLLIASIGCILL